MVRRARRGEPARRPAPPRLIRAAGREGQGTLVQFRTPQVAFQGILYAHPISRALLAELPISSTVKRWGEEIYFEVPVHMTNIEPTSDVSVGDIAYWPEGPCVCVFFGKTPASKGKAPRPASDVTIIGSTDTPVEVLRSIKEGGFLVISHADSGQDTPV